jgi:nucleoside-diphosphate-sugar epimerase
VTIVRPATIFGARSKDWVVELGRHLLARSAVTIDRGRPRAGLVHVDDVADAMVRLATVRGAIGQAYNVVDPKPTTWREYFDYVADALGAPRARIDLPASVAFALARASEALYRLLGIGSRPLLTRHLVLLLTRRQDYAVAKLRDALGTFPATGVARGLILTADWLRSAEGRDAINRAGTH